MKIRLVSHASAVIESQGRRIWTDPWLFGKVFNNSWSLLPPAAFEPSMLDGIDFLWISHLHPDHFHLPSLASLPAAFKQRVSVLYQENNSEKIFGPLRQAGFTRFRVLRHRERIPLGEGSAVYCYRAGTLDSCLGVIEPEGALFNINDARLNSSDCRRVRADLGRIDTVLSQFSLAVYNGFEQRERYLRRGAGAVLQKLFQNHRDLGARVTIPFASLMYFSVADNRYMNHFANRPADVWHSARKRGFEVAILYPGDIYEPGQPFDSSGALARYDALYRELEELPYETPPEIALAAIRESFDTMTRHLHDKYPRLLLSLLRPLVVRIPDLGTTVCLSIPGRRFDEVADSRPPDLVLRSQALHFCFSHPYGLQTLSSSAQHSVVRNLTNWRLHRALFALNNAEVYGRLRYLLSRRTLSYLIDRAHALRRYDDLSVVGTAGISAAAPKRRREAET